MDEQIRFKVMVEKEIVATQIKCILPVYYGEEDVPYHFPGRHITPDKGTDHPPRDVVDITIDVVSGRILFWPIEPTSYTVYMKVCDGGCYYLYTNEGVRCIENEYVPCCIPGDADYIKFDIDQNGIIKDWKKFCTPRNLKISFFGQNGLNS